VTWNLIATGEVNDGVYAWTLPYINSSTVRVRITATDLAGNSASDESDDVFTIGMPDLTLTAEDISAEQARVGGKLKLTVSAIVHNIGLIDANRVLVRFSCGNLTPSENGVATVSWDWPAPGDYRITVTADPDNEILEVADNNNTAEKVITIGANGSISVGACVPNPEFANVYVTFSEVWVCRADGA
jgi:hypothetical protein